jgi:hypothetical protein
MSSLSHFCIVVEQVRKLEFLIAILVFTIAACFWAELGYAKPDAKEVVKGLFVPQLKGSGATGLAISLLGAMVMPLVIHAFFFFLFCSLKAYCHTLILYVFSSGTISSCTRHWYSLGKYHDQFVESK